MTYILLVGSVFLLGYCSRQPAEFVEGDTYRNLADGVAYAGMAQCRSCHSNVYDTYIHTGMGRSFGPATPRKSDAEFGRHALVYDTASNLYYKPFFQDSTLYIKEFRLSGQDTIHARTEAVAYIVGSGQHTNSHILNINGYLYQAPITYYTQEKKWDLAPGFEGGANSRFSRILTTECITCHNHYPEPVAGSINKYARMPSGIECERCHGPGEIHVREKLQGIVVDTATEIDYSIVNPANLSKELQMDLCQRCHLQGVTVLKEGKTFFDFKPGMRLSEVMNVFLPRYTNSDDRFIMASQADRLRLSNCYLLSDDLSCLTCHHPHHSIEKTDKVQYNQACLNCHRTEEDRVCLAPPERIEEEGNNCVGCHMRRSGSIDIPHVNITDHYISRETAALSSVGKKEEVNQEAKKSIARFLGLDILTKEEGTPLEMAQGYIALYDKFVESTVMLDSAWHYLTRCTDKDYEVDKAHIHYYFARKDFGQLQAYFGLLPPGQVKDGWTAYRLGEAAYQLQTFDLAVSYFEVAVEFLPYQLDFLEKLGNAYLQVNRIRDALVQYERVLTENEKRAGVLCNAGFAYALTGQYEKADQYYNRSIALDPDNEQAFLNKGALAMARGYRSEATTLLSRVLELNPQNEQARQLLNTAQ